MLKIVFLDAQTLGEDVSLAPKSGRKASVIGRVTGQEGVNIKLL